MFSLFLKGTNMTPNLFSSKGLSPKARPFLQTARAERQRNKIIRGIQLPLQKPLLGKDLDIFGSFRGYFRGV